MHIGRVIKQQRSISGLTLKDLSAKSGVSPSHIGRIERGSRLPSASVLRKLAQPLGFDEQTLFIDAGYLSPPQSSSETNIGRVDPYVFGVLAREPVEIQRALVSILKILKIMAKVVPMKQRC